jgi:dTDP-L-rhamnose 4-epimerase
MPRVLITGGAGFVGSHVADELLEKGYAVRALDVLAPQVHGDGAKRPVYLDEDVELQVGDVRDPAAVARALEGVDAVFHFAAAVGVGQSMYEMTHYTAVNNLGTAVLLEALARKPVQKLIVASSMSLYGEGIYRDKNGRIRAGRSRPASQLKAKRWELLDRDGEELLPEPTPEWKPAAPASIYALSKFDQEKMCCMVGRAYGIPTAAMRFFNIYGTRQALSNPYTGVLAIFASRYLNNRPPMINEDGEQKRDFVSVKDVARACRAALETPASAGKVFNIGSGRCFTVNEIADRMGKALGREHVRPEITGSYRVGDIRHCFADISQARRILGYAPQVELEQGMVELASWLEGRQAEDKVIQARQELAMRGLTA